MPSANNPNTVKAERTGGPEQPDPLRQAIIIIEHKIRNLEKRKSKLDSYREIKASGKSLTREQTDAVSKYDEVLQHLELSREYVKQFVLIGDTADKGKKRQAKRDVLERTAADTAKIKQVLIIQDVLQNMGGDQVREDFLAGSNGAPQLTELDLKSLDDLYGEIYPKRDSSTPFATQLQKASEHLMTIIEGKPREVAGVTGAKLQVLVSKISNCGYFDVQDAPAAATPEADTAAPESVPEPDAYAEAACPPTDNDPLEDTPTLPPPQQVIQQQQQPLPNIPAAAMHPLIQNIVPVSQVESNIFNAQGFQPPTNGVGVAAVPAAVTQLPVSGAPLTADPMSRLTTNLTFFQESQIDTTELPAAPITSRTFTNQNFNGQPVPPSLPTMPYPPANGAYFVSQPYGGGSGGYGGAADMGGMYPVANGAAAAAPPASVLPDPVHTFSHPQSQHVTSNGYSGVTQSYQMPVAAAQAQPQPQPAVSEPVIPAQNEESQPEVGEWNGGESRLDWAADSIDEWNPAQPDEGTKRSGGRGRSDRGGDRPRNYNRNNNRNNYNNSRSGNRESGGNFYSNNQNGYQSRDREYQPRQDRERDYQPRQDREPREYQPRAEKEFQPRDREQNGGGYGGSGFRRGGGGGGAPRPPRQDRPDRQDRQDRPPRSDRQDRPYSNSGAGNNQGGRQPRGRPSGYRQETTDAK